MKDAASHQLPVVYGRPGCVQCKYTAKVLKDRQVPFDYVDISVNPVAEEHVKSLGYTNLPVVETHSDHWSGFKLDKLRSIG